jgi:S-(hydroxymethyl)glutathione dehydrogenase / alcohol dehydrogenase
MKIRAAVLREPGARFAVTEVDLQEPGTGEVRVRVLAVGVCHSDWHLVTGDTKHPMPLVAGHEGAGVVDAVGDGVSLQPGDFVSLNWAPNCGSCFYCDVGRPSLCETYVDPIWAGTMLDGTTRLSKDGQPIYHYSALACFAEYCVVPEPCCVKMPKDIPPELAAVIGCAVMTGVGSVLNTAKVPAGASVAVIGAGGVGLSTIMGAKLAGASEIVAIDPLPQRQGAALDVGASAAYVACDAYSSTRVRGPDYVFEAVGKTESQEQAVELVRPGGTVVLSGLSPSGSNTNIPGAKLVRQEKTVMGSYYGTANTARDFPLYAELWKQGKLPLEKLVSHRYSLDQINEAYADMLSGTSRRGVIVF